MPARRGFFDRLFGRNAPAPASSPEEPVAIEAPSLAFRPERAPQPPNADLEAVVADDPAAAIEAFARLRSTPDEARAIDALLGKNQLRPLGDELALRVAAALLDRAEPARALALLEGRSSPATLLLLADLEADRGELHRALALVERIALRDIDFAGARERLVRLRGELGIVPPPAPSNASQTVVGTRETDSPFVLLREVARGGAGAVYEAEDRDLGRRVALKIYHDDAPGHAQLGHEARVAASLAGSGIVRVLDVDLDRAWLALEWAAGGSLRNALQARALDVLAPLASWALPLARALGRVHAAGWAHLDVKPANVLFDAKRRLLLGDFGIAQRIGEKTVGGSMGYMSPERLAGIPAAATDDVYGFGRIIEEVLPFAPDPAWRAIADVCLAAAEKRPADGSALEACILQVMTPTRRSQ